MKMYIYASTKRGYTGELTSICVETNLAFAVPYWAKRKESNKSLFWEIK